MEEDRTILTSNTRIWSTHIQWMAILLAVSFIIRLLSAMTVVHPGHADSSYYITVANNLYKGRGFVIDYIWNFQNTYPDLTHPSNDYWMPLSSIFMFFSFLIFGNSLLAAQLPGIIFTSLVAPITYFIAIKEFRDKKIAILAAILAVILIPRFILLPEATPLSGLLTAGMILLIAYSYKKLNFFLAGVCGGLAYLTRSDGVLILLALVSVILFSELMLLEKGKLMGIVAASVMLVVFPWWIRNYIVFDTVFPVKMSSVFFLNNFEDFYSSPVKLNSAIAILPAIFDKLMQANENIQTIIGMIGWPVFLFIPFGIALVWNSRLYRITFVYFSFLFLFYSFIANILASQGSFARSGVSLIPFLLPVAIKGVFQFSAFLEKFSNLKAAKIITVVFCGLFLFTLFKSVNVIKMTYEGCVGIKNSLEKISLAIERYQPVSSAVLMTRNPWEVHYSLGSRTVQIPNNDLDVIIEVAKKYNVDFLLTARGLRQAFEQPNWMEIWREDSGTSVELILSEPSGMKLYRIIKQKAN